MVAIAAVLVGCSEEAATAIVVIVDTDLSVPGELDTIRIVTIAPDTSLQESESALSAASDLPAFVTLSHTGGSLGPYTVRAMGYLDGSPIIERIARVSFVAGKTIVLPLHLARACLDVDCPMGETCTEAGCLSETVAEDELETWTGEPPRLTSPDADIDRDADVPDDADGDGDADSGASPCETPGQCDDGVECTQDVCRSDGTCSNSPDDSVCEGDRTVCDPAVGCSLELYCDVSCEGSCGEGTAEAPFLSIEEALAAAPEGLEGLTVVIAEGAYAEAGMEISADDMQVALIGGPGVTWVSEDDVALKVSSKARVFLEQLDLVAGKTPVEVKDEAEATLSQVTLSGGSEYGIKTKNTASAELDRCLVTGNARAGMQGEGSSSLRVVNSLIVGNGGADEGGAISLRDADVALEAINCTLADNDGGTRPGAIRNEEGCEMTLINLVLWENGDPPAEQCEGCVLGADSLSGDVDPLFVTPTGRGEADDYRIGASSPARDNGVADVWVPDIDYWGDDRDDGNVDSGADEYRP